MWCSPQLLKQNPQLKKIKINIVLEEPLRVNPAEQRTWLQFSSKQILLLEKLNIVVIVKIWLRNISWSQVHSAYYFVMLVVLPVHIYVFKIGSLWHQWQFNLIDSKGKVGRNVRICLDNKHYLNDQSLWQCKGQNLSSKLGTCYENLKKPQPLNECYGCYHVRVLLQIQLK